LSQNGYNEQRYVETLRQDIPRSLVLESLAAGVRVPDLLADRIYRHRNEKRGGETVFVAASEFSDVGSPTDEQVRQIYEENKDRFTAPEYRAVSVVKVGAEELLASVKPTEEQIREEFETRSSEFVVPEKREVEQILIADEAAAKSAYAKIKNGSDFFAVARETASQTPEQTKLGLYTRDELPEELSNAVFALGEGAVTEPIKSDFGWHIVRVSKVEPGKDARLDDVRDGLTKEVAQRLAADQAYETAVKIDEELTRGAQLAEAATKHGLAMIKVEAVDSRGVGADGAPVAVFADASDVVQRVFETAAGAVEQLVESQSGAWYIYRVDQITPAQLRPLEEVRGAAIALWEAQQRDIKARERAEKILERAKGGATLEAAGGEHGLKVDKIPPATRSGEGDGGTRIQADLAARLFGLKPGDLALAPTRGGYHVLRLVDIVPADPAADSQAVERIRGELRQQMANDLVSEYGAALRERHGVEIRRDVIERLL
jgi:peptidyl-prolyl cis-trans isomerase D